MAAEGACEAFQEGVFPMTGEHSPCIEPIRRSAETQQAHQTLVHLVVGLRRLGEFREGLGLRDRSKQRGNVADFYTRKGREGCGGQVR